MRETQNIKQPCTGPHLSAVRLQPHDLGGRVAVCGAGEAEAAHVVLQHLAGHARDHRGGSV